MIPEHKIRSILRALPGDREKAEKGEKRVRGEGKGEEMREEERKGEERKVHEHC